MTPLQITLLIIGIVLFILLSLLLPPFFIAKNVYKDQLVRTSKDKWGRTCSAPDNEEQVRMYKIGEEWASENMNYAIDVEVTSYDNLHLVGQYFDFGFDKACIIIQGRTESYLYSHYYAKPYKDIGYNVLVIDSRAHGLSEGKYNCVGLKEYNDILAWGNLLHTKFNMNHIILHGICIGAATAMYTITSENCPDYYKGIVVDGMYTTFYETFRTHMIAIKRPVFPFALYVMLYIKLYGGVNALTNGPIKSIKKLNKPLLMIHSKQDIFSLPPKAELLYSLCNSPKRIEWFEIGGHSHVRINNQEKYDQAIASFVKEFINE